MLQQGAPRVCRTHRILTTFVVLAIWTVAADKDILFSYTLHIDAFNQYAAMMVRTLTIGAHLDGTTSQVACSATGLT